MASEGRLYIFSDGPKTLQDEVKVAEVSSIINQATGFYALEIIESTKMQVWQIQSLPV